MGDKTYPMSEKLAIELDAIDGKGLKCMTEEMRRDCKNVEELVYWAYSGRNDPVIGGTTYRPVSIAVELTSRFDLISFEEYLYVNTEGPEPEPQYERGLTLWAMPEPPFADRLYKGRIWGTDSLLHKGRVWGNYLIYGWDPVEGYEGIYKVLYLCLDLQDLMGVVPGHGFIAVGDKKIGLCRLLKQAVNRLKAFGA